MIKPPGKPGPSIFRPKQPKRTPMVTGSRKAFATSAAAAAKLGVCLKGSSHLQTQRAQGAFALTAPVPANSSESRRRFLLSLQVAFLLRSGLQAKDSSPVPALQAGQGLSDRAENVRLSFGRHLPGPDDPRQPVHCLQAQKLSARARRVQASQFTK